jgi:hypothetical protein
MISAVRGLLVVAVVVVLGCGGESQDEPEPPLVATLGDSITAGAPRWSPDPIRRQLLRGRPTPKSQWQFWAQRATDGEFRFRNCGHEGDRTDEIEARFGECTRGADVVVIQGGTNDIAQGRTPATAAVNLREMIQRAKAAGLRTLVTTIPPVNVQYPRWAPEAARLNRQIRVIAQREDVPVIDFFGLLEDPARPGRMPPQLTDDGVHPTVRGYARIGSAAARELE